MKIKLGVIVLMILVFAGTTHADSTPTVSLTASSTSVSTTAILTTTAIDTDSPPTAGIKRITLYANGNVYRTYDCSNNPTCVYVETIVHTNPVNETYYSIAVDKGDNSVKSNNVTVIYTGMNLAPVIQNLPAQNKNEDSGSHSHLLDLWNYTSDNWTADENLTFSIFWQKNTSIADCSIEANQYVNCTLPTPNAFGQSIITVQASDGELQTKKNFTFNVLSVNDVPWMNSTIANISFNEESYDDSINLPNHFTDVESEQLVYSFVTSNENITVTENSGIMNITSAQDYYGNSTLTIIVSDRENSTNETIGIQVLPVNDLPYFTPSLANKTAIRYLPFVYDINVSDKEMHPIIYTDNSSLFAIDLNTGLINFTPVTFGNYSINITACDNDCISEIFNLEIIYIPQPGFENNTPTNITYQEKTSYEIFIDLILRSIVDIAQIEINGINITGTHTSNNTYKANIPHLATGNHTYKWHANYTNSLFNTSQNYNLEIKKAQH
ncbi:hypothetical protein GF358_01580, partial [Candidatus Woesearchaeota archaeon]|nr:hypothetical protein [Candidatus Woesearchaeota archaeon]